MKKISEAQPELVAWDCPQSYGEPTCVSTSGPEGGYSVNLYVRGGVIIGVEVHERDLNKKRDECEHVFVGLTPSADKE